MEVKAAITATADKAPGQDGYSREYYKCFQDVLCPVLTLLYKDIISTQSMPHNTNTAVISLLPKFNTNLHTGKFHPSLLNND